jgi:ATP-dependent helicase HepA
MTLRTARRGINAGKDFWGCTKYPSCKGSLNFDGSPSRRTSTPAVVSSAGAATSRGKRTPIRRGELFVSNTNALGAGKAVDVDGDDLVLEYFDTPEQEPEDRARLPVPRTGLSRFKLKPEMRVFWVSGEQWRSGRIIEVTQHRDIYVRSHNWEGYVPEKHLFVRWQRPLSDPVGFAAAGLLESPMLADLRRPFLRAILRQRSAARGMSGALSSAIELHDHQLEVAWLVLQDPVQRYLLADEVGLGKTIEAGIVLRQLLLENPELSVQLILPPFLIGQWEQELVSKFFINDFAKADIRYARNDEPSSWAPADLLIVDEAHNLAALPDSDQPELTARYARLEQTALDSTRLLMLSATPALSNEPAFLRMLKLLDPAMYADVSVDDLRKRLAARAGLGRIFLGLQPTLPASLVRNRLAELRKELPADTDVERLLDGASGALDAGDRNALRAAIDDIRTHVAEVYRIHRRMLRTRRTSALQATYRVTGRTPPEPLMLKSDLLVETTRLVEAWRQEALAAHEDDPTALQSAARALAEAVSLSLDPESLSEWARSRAAATRGEQIALDRVAQDLAFTNRRDAVAKPIADALSYLFNDKERVVVFCPTSDLVSELAHELQAFLPATAVLKHRTTDTPAAIESVIRRFESARDTAILVADCSAEEGRNFQFADLLVHVGVRSDANSMEQRIGRCDRWQMSDLSGRWRSLLVTDNCASETFASAWVRILKEGFRVFDSSIASLQLAVEAATDRAWQRLLIEGIGATDLIIQSVRSSLEVEIERIREQDALDTIESSAERGSVYNQVSEAESSESEFAEFAHSLLATDQAPGNLRFRVIGDPVHGVGGYDAFTRLPGKQLGIPLVSLERLERDFLPIRDQRGTYLRAVAVKQRGTHVYRYGDPFIDAVSDFLWHDDRGRAFGMWRWIPDWGYRDRVSYRFDYAVEAQPLTNDLVADLLRKLSERDRSADRATLMHRADGLFPPLIVTVWLDERGQQLTDPRLLEVLEEPYRKPQEHQAGGDYSLNLSRIEAAYRHVPAAQWAKRWHASESAAVNFVRGLPDVREAVAMGLQRAHADWVKRVKRLELRASRAASRERVAIERDVGFEEAAGQALTAAINDPTPRLDCTGIVIVSGDELAVGDE